MGRVEFEPTGEPRKPAPSHWGFTRLRDFLSKPIEPYHWLVPDVLERGDRIILTGGEGNGKSTLLRQWALMAASGHHWFTNAPIDPVRVAVFDLENSERQIRRAIDKMSPAQVAKAGGKVLFKSMPEGLDLLAEDGEAVKRLVDVVTVQKVDILFVGPLYKLVGGDPVKEEPARAAALALDKIRAATDCAVVMEAHTAKAADDKRRCRPREPYGASLWLRWPEFGLHLGEDGALTHWRGPRDQRSWPGALVRSPGMWPWGADFSARVTDPDEEDRRKMLAVIAAKDGQLSGRGVATECGYCATDKRAEQLLAQLIGRGLVRREPGRGNSFLHYVVRHTE